MIAGLSGVTPDGPERSSSSRDLGVHGMAVGGRWRDKLSEVQPGADPDYRDGSRHVSKAGIVFLAPGPFLPPARSDPVPSGVEPSGVTHRTGQIGHAAVPARKGLAFVSLLSGVLGLVTPWLPVRGFVSTPGVTLWLPFFGVVFAPLAIVFGIMAGARLRGSLKGKKMAIAGLSLGLFYVVLLAGSFVFVLVTGG